MRTLKLAVMVSLTTLLATALCYLAMLIPAPSRTEYADYRTMSLFGGYLALFHLVLFMIPLTLSLEPSPFGLSWLYYALSIMVALVWTILLDGPEQPVSYLLAILVGALCALCWTGLLRLLRPWKVSDA